MKFKSGDPEKDKDTNEKYITITISNSDIKRIKSAIEWYKGDADDTKNKEKTEELRNNIHQVWRKLNPS